MPYTQEQLEQEIEKTKELQAAAAKTISENELIRSDVQNKQRSLDDREKALNEHETAIISREDHLGNREAQVAAREAEIAGNEQKATDTLKATQDAAAALKATTQTECDALLDRARKEASAYEGAISQLEERESAVEQREADVAEQEGIIDAKIEDLEKREKQLSHDKQTYREEIKQEMLARVSN